ncbi:reverse transcriptase family protein [Marinicellulosiphila megalodicopiae]|uniref:reverse transcriptase family protein n=1 Tax=Marinicellulosiphila megalodicopiae TaxID=2724896 RepID=UPI003BB01885
MQTSAPGKLTRQQLYDLIRQSSKDEYILKEMIRLGFWNESTGKPSLTKEFIERKGELEKQYSQLLKIHHKYQSTESLLKAFHKERKEKALLHREETKLKNKKIKFEKAQNWFKKNLTDILYLGENVSFGLNGKFTDRDKLKSNSLPVIEDIESLANSIGVSVSEIRFLSYDRKVSKVSHYQQFLIAKKTGGTRKISAPMPRLKHVQYWILTNILEKVAIHDCAHGFVTGKSIVTNAEPHVGADVVINMDLENFFPTVTYKRVKGVFCNLGYSEKISTVLALLCSQADNCEVVLDNQTYFRNQGERFLPQGAPTSPALTNILCRKLDKRMLGMSNQLGFKYTRYADDLTFSSSQKTAHNLQKLFWRVNQIIPDEGFILHPDKTRVMRSNNKQEVTGVVVNEKLSVDRKTLKRFRALLFQINKDGLGDKSWGKGALIPSIEGYANFVYMVNPIKGVELQKAVVLIKQKYGAPVKPHKLSLLNKKLMRFKAKEGLLPKKDWWKPKQKSAPLVELTQIQNEALKGQPGKRPTEKSDSQNQNGIEDENTFDIQRTVNENNTPFQILTYALLIIPFIIFILYISR